MRRSTVLSLPLQLVFPVKYCGFLPLPPSSHPTVGRLGAEKQNNDLRHKLLIFGHSLQNFKILFFDL